jgi:hypothetical protein
MEAREAYLESLPGAQFKDDIRALNLCSYTMGHNGVELENHVRQFMGAPVLQEELSDDFENELVRLLHNFLASVAWQGNVFRPQLAAIVRIFFTGIKGAVASIRTSPT